MEPIVGFLDRERLGGWASWCQRWGSWVSKESGRSDGGEQGTLLLEQLHCWNSRDRKEKMWDFCFVVRMHFPFDVFSRDCSGCLDCLQFIFSYLTPVSLITHLAEAGSPSSHLYRVHSGVSTVLSQRWVRMGKGLSTESVLLLLLWCIILPCSQRLQQRSPTRISWLAFLDHSNIITPCLNWRRQPRCSFSDKPALGWPAGPHCRAVPSAWHLQRDAWDQESGMQNLILALMNRMGKSLSLSLPISKWR